MVILFFKSFFISFFAFNMIYAFAKDFTEAFKNIF